METLYNVRVDVMMPAPLARVLGLCAERIDKDRTRATTGERGAPPSGRAALMRDLIAQGIKGSEAAQRELRAIAKDRSLSKELRDYASSLLVS